MESLDEVFAQLAGSGFRRRFFSADAVEHGRDLDGTVVQRGASRPAASHMRAESGGRPSSWFGRPDFAVKTDLDAARHWRGCSWCTTPTRSPRPRGATTRRSIGSRTSRRSADRGAARKGCARRRPMCQPHAGEPRRRRQSGAGEGGNAMPQQDTPAGRRAPSRRRFLGGRRCRRRARRRRRLPPARGASPRIRPGRRAHALPGRRHRGARQEALHRAARQLHHPPRRHRLSAGRRARPGTPPAASWSGPTSRTTSACG